MVINELGEMEAVSVKEIFFGSQDSSQSLAKSVRALNKLFARCKGKGKMELFLEDFIYCLKHCLIVGEQAPVVDHTMDLAVTFILATSAECVNADEDSDDEDSMSEQSFFVKHCWSFLLQSQDARSPAVRYRACQMIGKLLNAMEDDVQVSVQLYGDLQRAMILRLSDKMPNVRTAAAKGLARLQEPTDDCPATKVMLRYLSRDPHADVRHAILSSLLPSKKVVIPVLGRTLDVKESVRKAAYEYLSSRFHIRSLTIAQRVKLLKQGLKERSDVIQKACKQSLIPSWYQMLGGDLLEFLRCLDVQDASEITEIALIELLDKKYNSEFLASFNLLGQDRIIRDELISAESVFYWRVLCEYLKKKGGSDGDEEVDQLEKVLPDLLPFCTFINKYAQSMSLNDDIMENLDKEFICEQLIHITGLYDLVDEAHRKFMNQLAKNIFHSPKFGVGLISSALKVVKLVIPDAVERAHYLMETIADIREPIDVIEIGRTALEQRQNQLAIAKIRVDLNIARDELDTYVQQQDFEQAKETKLRLTQLDKQLAFLTEDQAPRTQEVRVEKNDDFTLRKCLAIACGILEDPRCKLEIARLHSLIENLILKCVQSVSEVVRRKAVQALGLACQMSVDIACRNLFLFVQIFQLDTEEIRLTAFKSVFDLIILYGFESFKGNDGTPVGDSYNSNGEDSAFVPSSTDSAVSTTDPMGELLSILVNNLDSEITAVHTIIAEGLAKLLLSGRVISAKIISRLIIMYFNPVNTENNCLLNVLSEFFPAFAAASVSNRGMLSDAFLPTLRLVFQAPVSSPLSFIDVGKIGALFIQLTRPLLDNYERRAQDPELNNPHDNLCIAICNEILRNPQHFGVPWLVDFLRLFHVSVNRKPILMDIWFLVGSIIKKLKYKRTINKLKKFSSDIERVLLMIDEREGLTLEDGCPRVIPETPRSEMRHLSNFVDSSEDENGEGSGSDDDDGDNSDDDVSK